MDNAISLSLSPAAFPETNRDGDWKTQRDDAFASVRGPHLLSGVPNVRFESDALIIKQTLNKTSR